MIQQLNQSFNKQEKHQMHCHNLKKKPSDLSSPHYTSCCVLHILFSLQHILLCHPHYTFCCVLPTAHPVVFSPLHILLCHPLYASCCVLPTTHPVVKKVLRTHLPSDVILISATSAGVPTNAPMPPAVTPIKAFMAKLGGFPSLAATETNTSLVSCSGACLYYMCQPTPLPKTKNKLKKTEIFGPVSKACTQIWKCSIIMMFFPVIPQ